MEIEKQRGISVTSTVLQFDYLGAGSTSSTRPATKTSARTRTVRWRAADSAVMLIDAAKGVEPQTIKLFEVCRMRGIPIFTFINKLDRHGKDPFELMEEIERVLGIRSCPINWPIGMGPDFQGIYHRMEGRFERFTSRAEDMTSIDVPDLGDPGLAELLSEPLWHKLQEDIELLDVAGDPFDADLVRQGRLTPVYFGSAIANFGVASFLRSFVELAPPPGPRQTSAGVMDPGDDRFSGFVFKIQANMNPAHRDRIAFVRICSGRFARGMTVTHVQSGKKLALSQPQQFFGQDRETVDEAYAGDIIGIHDPGLFRIGDTLVERGQFTFPPLPSFSPEHFARVSVPNALKYKQFHKGIAELSEEGAVQLFRQANRTEDLVLGAVGQLQFDVFEYRMKNEYGVDVEMIRLPYRFARWLESDAPIENLQFDRYATLVVRDRDERVVLLFQTEFAIQWMLDKNPGVKLHKTSFELDAERVRA